MTGLNQDQTLTAGQEKTGKAKPVAVDSKAKELAQADRLTSEERLAAIKELLAEDIALQNKHGATDAEYYRASYKTKDGYVLIYAENKDTNKTGTVMLGNITIEKPLPESTPSAAASKKVSIDSDGNFRLLQTITRYDPSILSDSSLNEVVIKGSDLSKGERAERFADSLIKDALEAKKSEAK